MTERFEELAGEVMARVSMNGLLCALGDCNPAKLHLTLDIPTYQTLTQLYLNNFLW